MPKDADTASRSQSFMEVTTMDFKGAAKRLDAVDWPRMATAIKADEDALRALAEVEAAGSGFDDQGRPKMLFEPHIFYRLLGPGKARDKAVKAGVAYAKWKKTGYPKDSYPRLGKAMKINATIAMMSASWGAFQIMGFNHGAAGYAAPEEMVRDFMADEDNHVEAAVRFIVNKKLDDDLRAHRWDVIEKVYNGGGYGGAYARKMEKAFARWQKIKDTPLRPENLTQEGPSVAPGPSAQPKPETQPSTPPSHAQGPSPGQAATTAVVVGGGATAMGVPWQDVAVGLALVAAAIVIWIVLKRRKP